MLSVYVAGEKNGIREQTKFPHVRRVDYSIANTREEVWVDTDVVPRDAVGRCQKFPHLYYGNLPVYLHNPRGFDRGVMPLPSPYAVVSVRPRENGLLDARLGAPLVRKGKPADHPSRVVLPVSAVSVAKIVGTRHVTLQADGHDIEELGARLEHLGLEPFYTGTHRALYKGAGDTECFIGTEDAIGRSMESDPSVGQRQLLLVTAGRNAGTLVRAFRNGNHQ